MGNGRAERMKEVRKEEEEEMEKDGRKE